MRLDLFLVQNNYFNSRAKAQEAIKNGNVYCDGVVIKKCSYIVNTDNITIKNTLKYVSRGGLKLEKALNYFNISLNNKVMCDIGSSTGGFSDCALQNGVKKIYAIDVGTNQFDVSLRNNPKIVLMENTDFRNVVPEILNDINIITIDVSFISVTKLVSYIEKYKSVSEIVCLIKPQFECGKEIADKYKGIILSKNVHSDVINSVISSFNSIGFYESDLTYSPIKGGSGNIEYLLYLTKEKRKVNIADVVNAAFKNR